MKISTKGRYALRMMLDLAEHANGSFVALKDIAERQNISKKYLEQIIPVLNKSRILKTVRGSQGGYMLARTPDQYTVGEILRLTEGDLAPVACLACDAKTCEREYECRTYPMWVEFYRVINEFFDGKTLADVIQTDPADNYSI